MAMAKGLLREEKDGKYLLFYLFSLWGLRKNGVELWGGYGGGEDYCFV